MCLRELNQVLVSIHLEQSAVMGTMVLGSPDDHCPEVIFCLVWDALLPVVNMSYNPWLIKNPINKESDKT